MLIESGPGSAVASQKVGRQFVQGNRRAFALAWRTADNKPKPTLVLPRKGANQQPSGWGRATGSNAWSAKPALISIKALKLSFPIPHGAPARCDWDARHPAATTSVDATLNDNLEKASPMASCPSRPAKPRGSPGGPGQRPHSLALLPDGRRPDDPPPITTRWTEPIDRGFAETDNNGAKRHPTGSEPS